MNAADRQTQAPGTPGFSVLVQRDARPPLPWSWQIRKQSDSSTQQRAVRGYRSAEEAWEAGRAALARLGQQRAEP